MDNNPLQQGDAPAIVAQTRNQAQIEALKELSDKLNVHIAKYHPDCPYCEVLELIDQQIEEIKNGNN